MTGCNLVLHFPGITISSSHCFFMVRHFRILEILCPQWYWWYVLNALTHALKKLMQCINALKNNALTALIIITDVNTYW